MQTAKYPQISLKLDMFNMILAILTPDVFLLKEYSQLVKSYVKTVS